MQVVYDTRTCSPSSRFAQSQEARFGEVGGERLVEVDQADT